MEYYFWRRQDSLLIRVAYHSVCTLHYYCVWYQVCGPRGTFFHTKLKTKLEVGERRMQLLHVCGYLAVSSNLNSS